MTMTRTTSLFVSRRRASRRSSHRGRSRALSFSGRLRVTVPMPPAISTSTRSYAAIMPAPRSWRFPGRRRYTWYEVPLRFMYHVYRRRPGNRHDRGAGIMAAYERVLVEITGGIGTVTLNRPEKLNALDRPLCDDLREALALLTKSDVVRVIVITGAGRAFCAGADLDVLDEDGPALVAAGKDVALALRAAPQPVLAAVNGPAAGGGANLALACDYPVASEQASIGPVFYKLGLVPA